MNINEQFEAQQKELEALKAQVNQLRDALSGAMEHQWCGLRHNGRDETHEKWIATNKALSDSSEQCLNSVKADAITVATNHAYAAGYKRPIEFMHDYASKVRDGKA